MEKTVTDAIEFRRSVRKFDPKKDLDIDIVKKCIINATLAPTSSNLHFFKSKKDSLSEKQFNLTKRYYKKVIPFVYKDFFGILSLCKYLFAYIVGFFRVMYRQLNRSDSRIIAHKSAALASQNFMISMAGFSYDTCPMEGFDSVKVKRILNLNSKPEINMIIGCGIRLEEGIYGERFRIPFEKVYYKR